VVPDGKEPIANFQFRIGASSFYAEATNPPTGMGANPMSPAAQSTFGINPSQMYSNKLTQITNATRLNKLNIWRGWYYGVNAQGQHVGTGMVENYDPYPGQLDKNISINPGNSAVLSALVGQRLFYLKMVFLGFDPDTLVGQVRGRLSNAPLSE
jgi:hypothetical protein